MALGDQAVDRRTFLKAGVSASAAFAAVVFGRPKDAPEEERRGAIPPQILPEEMNADVVR